MTAVTTRRLLSVAIGLAALLDIRAVLAGDAAQEYVFKPLATVLILVLAATGPAPVHASPRGLVVAGLVASLAGDVFLMLPGEWFVPGLAAFLVAHVLYTVAFTRDGWRATPWPALACALYVTALLWWILPRAGHVQGPVTVYALVIGIMAWQALQRALAWRTTGPVLAAAGAVLFVVSDSALAANRFAEPFWWAPVAVMGTYVPAQWLIASSASGGWLAGRQ